MIVAASLLAVNIAAALLLAAFCSSGNVFFAVVDNYKVDGSQRHLELSHAVAVKGTIPARVSVDPKRVTIKPLARHLFCTNDEGVVAAAHPIKTADFAATWNRVSSTAPPALPLAAIESNFCDGAQRKAMTLYDDGTIVTGSVTKHVTREQLAEIRRLLSQPSNDMRDWLSYVSPGVQELTLYTDDGEIWSSAPVYSKCAPVGAEAERNFTPHRVRIVRAILDAAGDPNAFAGCGCVRD